MRDRGTLELIVIVAVGTIVGNLVLMLIGAVWQWAALVLRINLPTAIIVVCAVIAFLALLVILGRSADSQHNPWSK